MLRRVMSLAIDLRFRFVIAQSAPEKVPLPMFPKDVLDHVAPIRLVTTDEAEKLPSRHHLKVGFNRELLAVVSKHWKREENRF